MGLRSNLNNYYDPRNSFINDVLERRLGIPVSLAVVYLEIGRRLEIPIEGLGFPGHFLLKSRGSILNPCDHVGQ